MKPRFVTWGALAGIVIVAAGAASGQDYPYKPIRIVTSPIGGGADFAARLIAPRISGPLGQPVIVDNRAGVIAKELVAKAPPDGYTVLLDGSVLWIEPLLKGKSYDLERDFLPVAISSTAPNVLVVHPLLPANSVKELIVFAKARSGKVNYASGVTGSSAHIAGELFKAMAGIDIVRVPYNGNGPGLIGLMGGDVQLMFPSAASAAPLLKSGKLRALAVTSAEPSALMPGLPTVAAVVPGYQSVGVTGVFAPAKTPATIVNRLNQEIVRALNQPDVKQTLFNAGVEADSSSAERFAAMVKSEISRLGKLIREAGIKDE